MNEFCGSKLWDENITWNTETPDFTPCFQKTALVWIPCGFLWLLAPLEIYFQVHSNRKHIQWTGLVIFKLLLSTVLTVLSLVDMVRSLLVYIEGGNVFPSHYYAAFIKAISFILCAVLIHIGRLRGVRTSGVLFLFFLLLTIAEAVVYRSFLLQIFSESVSYSSTYDEFSFVITTCSLPLVLGMLILLSFADVKSEYSEPGEAVKLESPEESSSFLSNMTFWWFNSLAYTGYKKPLVMSDMWDLSERNKSQHISDYFDKHYLPMLKKAFSKENTPQPQPEVIIKDSETSDEDVNHPVGILMPILRTFGGTLGLAAFLKLIVSVLTFASPLVLDMLINFVSGGEPYWRGFFYAFLIFLAAMTESILNNQYEYLIYSVSMRIKSAFISAIYRKSLALSSGARRNYTVGEIVNLMSVDIQRVMDFFSVVNMLWAAPIQIALALYLLWQQIGISTLAGFGVMVVLVPMNGYITKKMRGQQVLVMKEKDKRTKLMNEILGGVKVLKLYGWEESFQEKVLDFRKEEIKQLTTQAYYSACMTFFFTAAPFLVALASFATFVLISPTNILDANRAFVSLSLFNILRFPFAFLPIVVMYSAMFSVSLKRINGFLSCEELDPEAISHDPSSEAVSVNEASFTWSSKEEATLKGINFNVPAGSLVAVVGTVGSGKSSLLSAILGDMLKTDGNVNISGSIAYVPQQAWIQNATLRKNIIFTKNFQESKYNKAIKNCCLQPDLEILPGGDLTEIGEKGINLSGGQKQRVSLARAVYNDSDIYLLDDPLSAVDAHVSKDIFENVIGPKGMLKKKTRVLVTHRITVLPEVDTIVVLKEGQITEVGSYQELLQNKGAFAEFLIQHLTQAADQVDAISINEISLFEEIAAKVGNPELQKQISQLSGGENDSMNSDAERGPPPVRGTSFSGLRRRSSTVGSQKALNRAESKLEIIKETARSKLTEVETSEVGSVKMSIYLDYFRSCGLMSCFYIFLAFAISHAFNIGSSIWLSVWSNDSLNPSSYNNTQLRDLRLGVYGGLGGAETIFILFGTLILSLATLKGSQLLHNQSLEHILRAPMSFFDTTPMGRILNRFSKDVDSIDNVIRFNMRMFLISAFRALVSLIVISIQTPFFLVTVLPLGILYYIIQKFYIASSRQLKRLESVSRSPIYTHFSETVSGTSSIRAFGMVDEFVKESNARVDVNHTSYFPSIAANRWLAIRLEFLGYCISFLAALFAVLTKDSLSPGITGLAVSYALTITTTLNMLVRASADVETNIVSVERCLEYTKTPVEADRRIESKKPKSDWPTEGKITFYDYSVRYREGLDLVLNHINCEIISKEKVGIVGRTGAGKSSLTLCLFRLIEAASGHIAIDGVDIAQLGLYDLRSRLTIIPQDPVLFTGTLRLNLDPFEAHTDEELWLALEHAHLKGYISSTEKGLGHLITEGGENLSVGQRQLLCLARALLRKTKILIMDEATAAVDMETDELIQTTIRKEFANCTVLTIAHRLNTILDYDRVVVLDKGEIKEYDSPANLLKLTSSIFYAMAKDADLV